MGERDVGERSSTVGATLIGRVVVVVIVVEGLSVGRWWTHLGTLPVKTRKHT